LPSPGLCHHRQQHDVQEPVLSPAESPAHRSKYATPAEPDAGERSDADQSLDAFPEATVADAAGMMQINGIKGIPLLITPESDRFIATLIS